MTQEKNDNEKTDYELRRDFYEQFKSPIPMHLSPEERAIWEKEYEWQKQELERRKKLGMYGSVKKVKGKGIGKNSTKKR